MIKIAFFDIDGTLIDYGSKPMTRKISYTLAELRRKGIKLCIATGRSPLTLPHFPGVEFDICMTFNGSYCTYGEKVIHSCYIAKEDVKTIVANAEKMGHGVIAESPTCNLANFADEGIKRYCEYTKNNVAVADDFEAICDADICALTIGIEEHEHSAVLEDVSNAKLSVWWDKAVDVIPSDCDKGVAVSKILEYFGYDKSEAIAFGDADNDIELLKSVGHGIAMENGTANIKAVATEICPCVSEDGIYEFFVKRGIIDEIE